MLRRPQPKHVKKLRKYALNWPDGYNFTPLVESYGRQCKATHALLNKLGHALPWACLVVDSGRVTKGAWIEGALRCAVQGE